MVHCVILSSYTDAMFQYFSLSNIFSLSHLPVFPSDRPINTIMFSLSLLFSLSLTPSLPPSFSPSPYIYVYMCMCISTYLYKIMYLIGLAYTYEGKHVIVDLLGLAHLSLFRLLLHQEADLYRIY
jgi:hypothetical protein